MIINNKRVYLFGFSRWKHKFIRPFLKEYSSKEIFFINPFFSHHYITALKKGLDKDSDIFIWGNKEFIDIRHYAEKNQINITRVEDGFIRSIELGSDLTKAYSLVFDNKGLYFDATKSSDLESILNHHRFDANLLDKAKDLHQKILSNELSKYNFTNHKRLNLQNKLCKILVTEQVDNDASVQYGLNKITSLDLLIKVRQENPSAYIIFKSHPDILSGNRTNKISNKQALMYCDLVITNISINSILKEVDEVHTITSLTGLEGLLYGKKVVTYGMPFYAGWGLTEDKVLLQRRKRTLTLEELIAGVYILYPKYINPNTNKTCELDIFINEFIKLKNKFDKFYLYRIKLVIYSKFSRLKQKFLRFLLKKKMTMRIHRKS